MKKQGCVIFLFTVSIFLTGCFSEIWTGASLVYDRHNVYKKISDYQLSGNLNHLLFDDKMLKQPGCSLDVAVFNGDVLVAGHLPTEELRDLALQRLKKLTGYRELFKQIAVMPPETIGSIEDGWITAKIRASIVADSSIDPNSFKILTADKIVYIMGDVRPNQALIVLNIARNTDGVIRVVKLLRYYNLSETPIPNG